MEQLGDGLNHSRCQESVGQCEFSVLLIFLLTTVNLTYSKLKCLHLKQKLSKVVFVLQRAVCDIWK